jgi:uncharacterized membrane protein YhhN
MKLTLALLFVLFWIILASDCFFILNGESEYRYYTKPLLMSILYITMALETVDTTHKRSKLIITFAILFSLGGDLLLLHDSDKLYFTLGLLCFLLVHILYAVFFFRMKRFALKRIGVVLVGLVLITGYLYFLLNQIWGRIVDEGLDIQIIAYSVASTIMFLAALNTVNGRRAKRAGWLNFVPGAILFIISDSLLGISKFYTFVNPPKELLPALNSAVMLSYGAAQMLIISGAVKFIKK